MAEISIEYHSDDRDYEAFENNLEIKEFDVLGDGEDDVYAFGIICDRGSVYLSKAEIIRIVNYWKGVEKDIMEEKRRKKKGSKE